MKRIAKGLLFALSVFAICSLSSCARESFDSTEGVIYLSETAPTGVGSFAIEGANVIYWDLLADNAYGLKIERYGGSDSVPRTVYTLAAGAGQSSTYFVDKVSFTNPLLNGETYTYRVYSLGGSSISTNRAAILANDLSTTVSAYAETSVVANVLPQNEKIAAFTEEDVKAQVVTNSDGVKKILVSFPENFVYTTKVVFNPAGTEYTTDEVIHTIDPSKYDYNSAILYNSKKGTYSFPFTGSKFDISITRQYFANKDPYYQESDAITLTVEGSKQMTTPATLTATGDKGKVILTWDALKYDATYTLYKAEMSSAYSTVIGDYSIVEIPETAKVTVYNGDIKEDGIYVVEDTDVKDGTNYKYVLVSKMDETYGSTYDTATPDAPIPVAPALTATVNTEKVAIDLEWEGVEDATDYELYRVEMDGSNEVSGTQVTITVPTKIERDGETTYEYGNYKVTDDKVVAGKTYKYKLWAKNANGYSPMATGTIEAAAPSFASEITGFTSKYNDDKFLYLDWNSTAKTFKVYSYTTSNLDVNSAITVYDSAKISTQEDGQFRFITEYKDPNETKEIVSYKSITFVVEAYDENGDLVPQTNINTYTNTILPQFTTYASIISSGTESYINNTVTVLLTGYNLDNAVLYKKDTSGDADWVKVGNFGAGTAVGSSFEYRLSFEDTRNLSYTLEVRHEKDNYYGGSVANRYYSVSAKIVSKIPNIVVETATSTDLTSLNSANSQFTKLKMQNAFTEKLTYQWYIMTPGTSEFTKLEGATSPEYTFETNPMTPTGNYQIALEINGVVSGVSAGQGVTDSGCTPITITVN